MKLVALANVRTRKILKPGNPDVHGPGQFSVTEEVNHLPSADPDRPTLFEVENEDEARALIAAGAAREESEYERDQRAKREVKLVPQVVRSAAPVGPGSGATVAPNPEDVARRAATAKPTHEMYAGAQDFSREPMATRHSAPVDLASSSPEAKRQEEERQQRPPEHRPVPKRG